CQYSLESILFETCPGIFWYQFGIGWFWPRMTMKAASGYLADSVLLVIFELPNCFSSNCKVAGSLPPELSMIESLFCGGVTSAVALTYILCLPRTPASAVANPLVLPLFKITTFADSFTSGLSDVSCLRNC